MKYTVWNMTDKIPVSQKPLTSQEADVLISAYPNRFKGQGYYLTSGGERIDPQSVKLIKLPVGKFPQNV